MADDNHRALEVAQKVLQPVNGLNVKVVGRLVQQQQIAAREQELCQTQLAALTAAQAAHGHRKLLFGKAQPQQRRTRAAFVGQTAEALVLLDQPHLLLDQSVDVLRLPRDAAVEHGKVALHLRQIIKHAQQLVIDVHLGIAAGVLLHITHTGIFFKGDRALGRRQLAVEHTEQRGLAHTVGADKAHLVARFHIKGHAAEQHALHKRDAEISDRKCRHDHPSFFCNNPILS